MWWLHNDINRDFKTDESDNTHNTTEDSVPYVCRVDVDQRPWNDRTELYYLKNRLDADRFVREYLTAFLEKWDDDNVDERDFSDWTHLKWRLNYGSGDAVQHNTL